jgi:hypothetical protein
MSEVDSLLRERPELSTDLSGPNRDIQSSPRRELGRLPTHAYECFHSLDVVNSIRRADGHSCQRAHESFESLPKLIRVIADIHRPAAAPLAEEKELRKRSANAHPMLRSIPLASIRDSQMRNRPLTVLTKLIHFMQSRLAYDA